MRMPSNFPLGQLASPTTGIFPGQAPEMGVYTSIIAAAPSVCVYVLYCTSMQISAMNVRELCKSCVCDWSKMWDRVWTLHFSAVSSVSAWGFVIMHKCGSSRAGMTLSHFAAKLPPPLWQLVVDDSVRKVDLARPQRNLTLTSFICVEAHHLTLLHTHSRMSTLTKTHAWAAADTNPLTKIPNLLCTSTAKHSHGYTQRQIHAVKSEPQMIRKQLLQLYEGNWWWYFFKISPAISLNL